jgi:acyl dehydratase
LKIQDGSKREVKMTSENVEFDRSLLGQEFPSGNYEVTSDVIKSYSTAVGETNPIHFDENKAKQSGYRSIVAPPTIVNILIRSLGRPKVNLSFNGMTAHAGQSLESFAPICAGDTIGAKTLLKDVYTKTGRTGTMAFVVWETVFSNQNDELVAKARESFFTQK